jgi:hypothetical protein
MRDIRPDLNERLGELKSEIVALRATLASKERHFSSTQELLARENEYWQSANQDQKTLFDSPAAPATNGHSHANNNGTLMEFIEKALTPGMGLTAKEIGQLAVERGFDFGHKSPSRAVHFRLLNLQKAGKAAQDGARWSVRNTS